MQKEDKRTLVGGCRTINVLVDQTVRLIDLMQDEGGGDDAQQITITFEQVPQLKKWLDEAVRGGHHEANS